MKIVAIIEARTSSSRLPGKVLLDLCGKPMLTRMAERVRRARRVDEVVIATTTNPLDDPIERMAEESALGCFRGSERDVLERVLRAAEAWSGDVIVELGGDAPLAEPLLIDEMVEAYLEGESDYVANTAMRHSAAWRKESTFPVGTGVEIFSTALLRRVAGWTDDPLDREHVTSYIFERPERFRLRAFEAVGRWVECRRPEVRLTVDNPEDFALIREIYARLYPGDPCFSLFSVMELLDAEPGLLDINRQVVQQRVFEQRQSQI